MTNKTYYLTLDKLPLTLTLTSPPSWGYCAVCFKDKEIWVISKHGNDLRRKFCQTCALDKLNQLATSNYQFTDREQTIEQIHSFLSKANYAAEEKEKILDCYE